MLSRSAQKILAALLLASSFGGLLACNRAGSKANASGLAPGVWPKLNECKGASLNRFSQWNASGEGETLPATGSLLKKAGSHYRAEIEFLGAEQWHVFALWLGPMFETSYDLRASKGLRIRYSTTAPLLMQLRPGFSWSGGEQWLTQLPNTSGETRERFIAFHQDEWFSLSELGQPKHTFKEALQDTRGLVFVGKQPNKITISALKIASFIPPCPTR